MILQGILVQSLNQYCIRGVARLADLEQLSTVDSGYQRNLIEKWRVEMEGFLQAPELFFPEVLLSYHLKDSTDPFAVLQAGKRLGAASDPIRFQVKKVTTKVNGVVQPTAHYVTIEIDEGKLIEPDGVTPTYPFFRIDGNHRLSAAASLAKNSDIANLNTPFCLLLLLSNTPDREETSRQFERTVFHNVNSKSVPLTREEILRVVVDPASKITDDQLTERFGAAHLYSRHQYDSLHNTHYPAIQKLFRPRPPHEPGQERRILWELHQLLFDFANITVASNASERTQEAFRRIDILYSAQPRLKASESVGLLMSFLFYAFRESEDGGTFRLEYFAKWVLQNHFCEIESVEPESLIKLFDQVFKGKGRQIFISMPFASEYNHHDKAFSTVIEEINKETKDPMPLLVRRIDKRIDGVTYQISEKVLEEIRTAGLLIADLSSSNPNVYHEVGYLMGLVAHNNLQPPNLILVCNTDKTAFPSIGFNLRGYKTLGFKDTGTLMPELKKEIMAHYYPETPNSTLI